MANALSVARKRGERSARKAAIPRIELRALSATCGQDLAALRDRALLCFAFASGGRRRSELAGASVAQLHTRPGGGFVYHLDRGQTLQDRPKVGSCPDKPAGRGRRRAAGLVGRLGRDRGRAVRPGVGPPGWPAPERPRHRPGHPAPRRTGGLAGLEGYFDEHRLRSGFITEGVRQGVSLPALMAMIDHHSVASVIGYYQHGQVADNPAAQLLEEP